MSTSPVTEPTSVDVAAIHAQRKSMHRVAKVRFLVTTNCTRVPVRDDGSKPSPAVIPMGCDRTDHQGRPDRDIGVTFLPGGRVNVHLPEFSLVGVPSVNVRIWE